jgi:hypothetical protein
MIRRRAAADFTLKMRKIIGDGAREAVCAPACTGMRRAYAGAGLRPDTRFAGPHCEPHKKQAKKFLFLNYPLYFVAENNIATLIRMAVPHYEGINVIF